jgi:hypothetical protein
LFSGVGSNSSVQTVASSGQEQQLLQNTARDNAPGSSERVTSLQNSSIINNILGTIGSGSSADSNNVILLKARTSRNIPDGAEGQVVRASVLLENGGSSGGSSRTVSMERSGVTAVNASVRGVFVKNEPLDSGAESGGAVAATGGITNITGSNGK